jgi:DNA adenine methylase
MSELNPKPFLKWAGGKRQLLPELKKYVPEFNRYFEPFVGAGALLFEMQPKVAVINDINEELINCYLVIKAHPKNLIDELTWFQNIKEFFYNVRDWDRKKQHPLDTFLNSMRKATRTIYLNKTCYNGLYRVNASGQFNAPYGYYKTEFKPDEKNILAVSSYLINNQVTILNTDFVEAVNDAGVGDFVYFDPPYDPIDETGFTSYTPGGFGKEDQLRLMRVAIDLTERGVKVMITNSNTKFINDLYRGRFVIHKVASKRNINSNGTGRGAVKDLIIMNYNRRGLLQ